MAGSGDFAYTTYRLPASLPLSVREVASAHVRALRKFDVLCKCNIKGLDKAFCLPCLSLVFCFIDLWSHRWIRGQGGLRKHRTIHILVIVALLAVDGKSA